MAKKYKIPIITWNIGYRKNTFYFAQKDTYHKIFPKRENNIKSLTKAQEQIISNYVRDRKERSSDWMWYVNSVNEKLTTDNLDQISSGKKIIGVFPNVFWDAQSHFDDAIYDDMYEFIDHIHKISQLYKDNIFIIRPHPAELNGQSQASILTQDYFNSFNSKNFYVLNANSSISSYTLAENSEFCISYASKIIPELSVMGKTVIVAGEAFAKGKGFTLDAQSKEDLENLVYNCVKGHRFNSLEEKVKALTFLYNYYYDWTVEFDCFSHTNKSNIPMIELNYSTKRELLNDKGMNKLLKLVEESLSEKKSV